MWPTAGISPTTSPAAKFVELPGDDILYWVGDTRQMLDEIEEFVTGVRGGAGAERILATLLFTDIVGSTDRAAQLGDGRWRDLLDRHDQSVRTQIERFRGREVKTVGDGFVATFDSPESSHRVRPGHPRTLKAFDIDVRAGIHTGEIEVRGDDVAGMAVHIGARVSALAGPARSWSHRPSRTVSSDRVWSSRNVGTTNSKACRALAPVLRLWLTRKGLCVLAVGRRRAMRPS